MKTNDMTKHNHQTKKEWLAKEVAKVVNAGKTWVPGYPVVGDIL